MKRVKIQAVRGTRDFYPEAMASRQWFYGKVRAVSERFGYSEYEGPILEPVELYTAKSGEALAQEQYTLQDKGGGTLVLRPELTPTLARMVAARQQRLPRPIRWWSWGPFWRYERPQKGRGREFFQWNLDCLGSESILCEAEVIAIAAEFLRSLGLAESEVTIRVNSRRLMDAEMTRLGVAPGKKGACLRLVDRRDKMPEDTWRAYAAESGFSTDQVEALSAFLARTQRWESDEELKTVFSHLETLGVRSLVSYDPSVVRGLDYYTGIVFEARDTAGAFRAILGGGRYDNLVADVGGEPLSGAGFAMGDMVIEEVLRKFGKLPQMRPAAARVLVAQFSSHEADKALSLATKLREAGISCELYPDAAKLDKQLKYADAQGIPYAAIVGPDEVKTGRVTIKDLAKREQKTVSLQEVTDLLRE